MASACGNNPFTACGNNPFTACGNNPFTACGNNPFTACGNNPFTDLLMDCGQRRYLCHCRWWQWLPWAHEETTSHLTQHIRSEALGCNFVPRTLQ
jgi:hypothetical protein